MQRRLKICPSHKQFGVNSLAYFRKDLHADLFFKKQRECLGNNANDVVGILIPHGNEHHIKYGLSFMEKILN